MAQANAATAVAVRALCAAFHRCIDRSQSDGSALGLHRAKRRLSGTLTATVIPTVAKESAPASVFIDHDTDARQTTKTMMQAAIGNSIKGGINFESRRINCCRRRRCDGASSVAAAGCTAKLPVRNAPATKPVAKTSMNRATHIFGI